MISSEIKPKPFVKWAGGKRQLLPELLARVPKTKTRYIEPFAGGGALFYALSAGGPIDAVIADANAQLIDAYLAIRDDVESLIARLAQLGEDHSKSNYYLTRTINPTSLTCKVRRAAHLIYLNKTCWNGLYRVNSKGLFNVPMGKFKKAPLICDENNLRACHRALQGVKILHQDFVTTMAMAKKGDFVYLDPPYLPLSKTSDFTAFTAGGFTFDDHKRLAEEALGLKRRGVKVLISNAGSDDIRRLYAKGFTIEEVAARRMINSNYMKRGDVTEFLIS